MIKDFFAARRDAQEALEKQSYLLQQKEGDLVFARGALNTFKNAFLSLDESDPEELAGLMKETILRYTIKMENLEKEINSITVNISSIRRDLKKYSLAPAIQ